MLRRSADKFDLALFVLRLVLGCVLLWSGVAKIRAPQDFLAVVYQYEVFGPRSGLVVAIILPWLEVVSAVLLLSGITVEAALIVAATLMAVFMGIIAMVLRKGLDVRCGCFGTSEHSRIDYMLFARACFFFVIAVLGFILAWHSSQRRANARSAISP